MERQPGAYIQKEGGTLEPDPNDEAMAKRMQKNKELSKESKQKSAKEAENAISK